MRRTLKGFGIIGGLVACQFGLGMLQPLAIMFYLNVAQPLYHWLHL